MSGQAADIIQTAFYSLVSGCALVAIQFLSRMSRSIDELKIEVHGLRKDAGHHEQRFESIEELQEDHEGRIRFLEKQGGT